MKLGRKISVQTMLKKGVEVDYVRLETLDPNIHEDITSIENIDKYGLLVCTDYLQVRSWIKELVLSSGGWINLNNAEKLITINYWVDDPTTDIATSDTNKAQWLIMNGYCDPTPEAASAYIATIIYPEFAIKEREACTKRRYSKKIVQVITKYLTILDANDLLETIEPELKDYAEKGLMGTQYNRVGATGIIDYFMSTGGYSGGLGFEAKGYNLITGTIASLQNEVIDVFVNGNY